MFKRPRLLTITVAPLVALATTLLVSWLGVHGLLVSSAALDSALRSAGSAHELEAIAFGIKDINADLYHVLTLRGAQTGAFDAAEQLHPLLVESDRVVTMLAGWRDTRATDAQRPQVAALISSVERYKGAVDFVSQMLDVDFVAAVSFVQPFDENYRGLMQAVDTLVGEVQARQRVDAAAALDTATTTMRGFEAVGAAAVLLALVAAWDMGVATLRSQRLARQNNVLTQMTQVDALTGLGNRRHFDESLARCWNECAARQEPLALIIFDIDHFKKFNDSQGHVAGDACLKRVGAAVLACSRDDTDKPARYGGEEFAIILPKSSLEHGEAVAERVRQAVAACAIAHPAAGPPGIVTVSLGVASLLPTAAGSPATLIERADEGLYAAKRGGRNRVGGVATVALREAVGDDT